MKRLTKLLILATFSVNAALAQNPVSLRQQSFPTDLPTEDDNIEWKQDIYREINLMENDNIGLYCTQESTDCRYGLFDTVFSLAVAEKIPIYRYNIDGNEVFNEDSKVDIKDILRNHHIFFQIKDGHVLIDKSDLPSDEVLAYYIKEEVFYDIANSNFRTRVIALCPILVEDNEFIDGLERYPLFWVKYDDIKPYLNNITIIPDYRNTAKVMSMTDFFARNLYKGDIYKVSNALGRTLNQIADSDSTLKAAQQHIENNIQRIQKTTYNTYYNSSYGTEMKQQEKTASRKMKKFFWQKRDVLKRDSE